MSSCLAVCKTLPWFDNCSFVRTDVNRICQSKSWYNLDAFICGIHHQTASCRCNVEVKMQCLPWNHYAWKHYDFSARVQHSAVPFAIFLKIFMYGITAFKLIFMIHLKCIAAFQLFHKSRNFFVQLNAQ